jgi:alkylation response protein AidB-like acyl-CoA dehydrogenase
MDFSISEELTALRASFRSFLDREVRPVEERFAERFWRGELDEEMREAATAVKQRSCAEGFYAAHMPESVGGWGLSNLGMTLLVEDAATAGMRLALFALGPPNPEAPDAAAARAARAPPRHLHRPAHGR